MRGQNREIGRLSDRKRDRREGKEMNRETEERGRRWGERQKRGKGDE